jgi:hypothetical protein
MLASHHDSEVTSRPIPNCCSRSNPAFDGPPVMSDVSACNRARRRPLAWPPSQWQGASVRTLTCRGVRRRWIGDPRHLATCGRVVLQRRHPCPAVLFALHLSLMVQDRRDASLPDDRLRTAHEMLMAQAMMLISCYRRSGAELLSFMLLRFCHAATKAPTLQESRGHETDDSLTRSR